MRLACRPGVVVRLAASVLMVNASLRADLLAHPAVQHHVVTQLDAAAANAHGRPGDLALDHLEPWLLLITICKVCCASLSH